MFSFTGQDGHNYFYQNIRSLAKGTLMVNVIFLKPLPKFEHITIVYTLHLV